MKKSILIPILTLLFIFSNINTSYSQFSFGITGGLSTPNNRINDIYNNDNLTFSKENFIGNLWRQGVKLGYNAGIILRLPLSNNFVFVGGISWNRFPESNIVILRQVNGQILDTAGTLSSTQNIIPISVGLNLYLIRSIIGLYATGDLTYNMISSTMDYKGIPLSDLNSPPTDNRVGFGLGAGIDLDIKLLTLNLEGKYHLANMIGASPGEKTKAYFTLNVGIIFGSSSSNKD